MSLVYRKMNEIKGIHNYAEKNRGWLEELPDNCPPTDATTDYAGTFFRLVKTYPPTIEDFKSQRALYPHKVFKGNPPECQARACSVFSGKTSCENVRRKYQVFKKKHIVSFVFSPKLGCCKKTDPNGHYSWWIAANFNVNSVLFSLEEVKYE